ncbi:hypothetical protein AMTRI_Chr05g72800 [Amborella trichopoda]|uniref:Flavin-containing monooxygenase n=1 Tax=Amborella trichopoda TaxID=13333 RepID=W1NN80_AMBTC|nr:probable indole-3-pyruvate monooxygenase YUCCA4 [Amborella trichopoda]ERM97058.1 hypothetical protein AMTR_s00122p00099920 [Amborella trichopoda]|eukprot:XP_006829642.1 probable indole-3-pyruvate monooxygenase YUCCA4 [Amborella trichopoda]
MGLLDTDLQGQNHRCVLVNGPIIIGAGPSGLAASACLRSHGVPSIILEKTDCIASLWQYRAYHRLKLHLPKHFCELPLMDFPPNFPLYPTKQQFISYIESYAEKFEIRPEFNRLVKSASYDPVCGFWRVKTADLSNGFLGNFVEYIGKWLVVATGENAEPLIPEIDGLNKFLGPVLHTSVYKTGEEFKEQKVLVVGCGNSGMEVCLDLCSHGAEAYMVARNSVHILPRDMFGISTFGVAMSLLNFFPLKLVDKFLLLMANLMLGRTEKYGLRRPSIGPIELKNGSGKTPVLDVGALSKIKSGGIKVMGGVKEVTHRGAKFVNGEEKEFDALILATGYKSNVPTWLKECDFFSEDGMPKMPFPNGWKGEKGLYSVGFTNRGILGAAQDARKVASDIALEWRKFSQFKRFIVIKPSLK